jgi:hypothetical protein
MAVLAGRAECETGVLLAEFADGCQFLDFLALGNQVKNLWEGSTEESTLQGGDNHDFAQVGRFLRKLNDVTEKLALVNTDNVELLPLVAEFR